MRERVKIVDKPWGREIWYAHTERYAGKVLEVKAGEALSLQYHQKKEETLFFRKGRGVLTLGEEKLRIEPGLAVTVPPGVPHRIEAEEDLEILEVSSPELEDVVRLEDRYGRAPSPTPPPAEGAEVPRGVFREYDLRGVYGREITEGLGQRLGWALAEFYRERGEDRVVVGWDNRTSSPRLAQALALGLTQGGCDVLLIGQVPTPVLYWAQVYYGLAPGVMVTASHNPQEENGFKIALGPGQTLYGEALKELYERTLKAKPLGPLGRVERADPLPAYVEMLAGRVRLARPLKVAVDCGNGTTSRAVRLLLKRMGLEGVELYCWDDPSFPHHHPDPAVPKNLQDLVQAVRATGAEVGLAFDGDGDRLGVVDDQGEILFGDRLIVLFLREILPRYPKAKVPVEVKCSDLVVEEARRLGGEPFFHRTGHSYLKATLKATGAPFAGEMSGHFFFADRYYGFDDAFYAALRLLEILSQKGPLSRLLKGLPRYPSTPEVRVPCPEERKPLAMEEIRAHFGGRYPLVEVDGVRVEFPEGWGLVRSSNTQPVLVLRAEGRTEEALGRIKAELEEALRRVGLEVQWPA